MLAGQVRFASPGHAVGVAGANAGKLESTRQCAGAFSEHSTAAPSTAETTSLRQSSKPRTIDRAERIAALPAANGHLHHAGCYFANFDRGATSHLIGHLPTPYGPLA